MQAKIEQKRSSNLRLRLLRIASDLPMHKLQLVVTPTAASLPALAVVALVLLLLATARRPCSFLDAYRSGVSLPISPSGPSHPRALGAAAYSVCSDCARHVRHRRGVRHCSSLRPRTPARQTS